MQFKFWASQNLNFRRPLNVNFETRHVQMSAKGRVDVGLPGGLCAYKQQPWTTIFFFVASLGLRGIV